MDSSNIKIKTVIGFIVYGEHTAKYLPYFLSSLKEQTNQNFKIVAFNNGDENGDNLKYLQANYPQIEIIGAGVNLGFAAAYNEMIRRAFIERADYFLMTNPDIIFEPDVLEKLVQRLEADRELGSVGPKILKWNFSAEAARAKAEWPQASGGSPNPALRSAEKTDIVDTYGIALKSGLRFFDVGQGKKDDQKFRYKHVVGPSGACGLFRMAALKRIKDNEKYLDERMFMYKEDCDLDYRLYLIHQESACVPEAVVYHDRTAAGIGIGDAEVIMARKYKTAHVRRWSLLNQQLIFKKYWHLQDSVSKLNIIFYLTKSFFYTLFFENFLLKDFLTIFRRPDKL